MQPPWPQHLPLPNASHVVTTHSAHITTLPLPACPSPNTSTAGMSLFQHFYCWHVPLPTDKAQTWAEGATAAEEREDAGAGGSARGGSEAMAMVGAAKAAWAAGAMERGVWAAGGGCKQVCGKEVWKCE